MQKDDRVVYLTQTGDEVSRYFNIPEKNTSLLMLGKGSSITDSAARKLAASNVVVGFCGSGGSPLFSSVDLAFLTPQSEYRPTEYMQKWACKWFVETNRIQMAKALINFRIDECKAAWKKNSRLTTERIDFPQDLANRFRVATGNAESTQAILIAEAAWAKGLYAHLAKAFMIENFTRNAGDKSTSSTADRVNSFMDHGNYLAYGLASVALNGLGISYSFPLLHGKTRRGALVFDVADIIKDAYVMPCSFEFGCNKKGSEKDFRSALIERFHTGNALDIMFNTIKQIALKEV